MNRKEANQRFDAAAEILKENGWTKRNFECAFDGLLREDAVEKAEKIAAQYQAA